MAENDFGLRVKYRDCCLEWRRLVRERQIAAKEQMIASNNLGAFYRFVNKRLSNCENCEREKLYGNQM